MSTALQLRRGTTAQHATFTGAVGEVTVDTDKDTVVVHDGATAGGFPLVRAADIANMLETADIGTTVQAYSATLASIAAGTPVALAGTTTNDSAATGDIGEYLEAVVPSASAVTITSGAAGNIATLSLTAGDWDVDGMLGFNTAPGTTVSYWGGGVSTASATLPAFQHQVREILSGATPNTGTYSSPYLNAPTRRISLASTTTIYLVGTVGYGVSTLNCFGALRARRVR